MDGLLYPDRRILEWWFGRLSQSTIFSQQELPHPDEEWYFQIIGAIDLLKLPHYPNTLHHKGAHLFYKIAKGHRVPNENKRSAVIVVYLFYLLNGHVIVVEPDRLLAIAHEIASSDAKNHENEVVRLEQVFADITRSITK